MKQQGYRSPILFFIGVGMLVLTLFTTSLTGGLYARYASGNADDDSARVSKFVIDESFSEISTYIPIELELQTDPDLPIFFATYAVQITNQSEVSVHSVLTPENMTGNLPLEFSVTEIDLAPGETDTVSITVSWRDGETSATYAGKTDLLRLTLLTQQVD